MDDDAFNELGYDDDDDVEHFHNRGEAQSPTGRIDVDLTSAQAPTKRSDAHLNRKGFELGDFNNPLDWHMKLEVDGNAAKRRKLEELENSIALTTLRIMDAKKLRQHQSMKKHTGAGDANVRNFKEGESRALKLTKFPPMSGVGWFGVSSGDSLHRGYLSSRARNLERSFVSEWENNENRELVSRKFCALIEQVRSENDRQDFAASEDIFDSLSSVSAPLGDNSLWIEKYNPTNFLDLVTEEEHNRCTLLWMRLWQEYVFHKKFNLNFLNEKDARFLETEEKHGRILPRFKIMVIQGPSGIGKSALAVAAAKQAGYNPFVIGITEMQGIADFRAKLDDISNLGSIQILLRGGLDAKKPKPTCLIIDGIDYAGADMVRLLSAWSTSDARKNSLRPVICTCNNLYTQNLKDLRSHCLILKISSCNKQRLMKRLQMIAKMEGIQINDTDLSILIELCRADIRLCLNTLQFFYSGIEHSKASKMDMENLGLLKLSDRGSDTSIFEALESILTLDHHLDKKGVALKISERCNQIQSLMSRRDDLDRFYQALFHNFSDAIKLTNCQRRRASSYFVESDLNYRIVYSTQSFTLLKYQSSFAIALHICVAVHVSKRLMFNLSFMAITDRQRESHEIVGSVRNGTLKSTLSFRFAELVHSILPILFYIIQPPIHGVNVQLFNGQDLNAISRVVKIMCAFKISYALKYEETGACYCFDPAIDLVVSFSNEKSTSTFLSNNTKKFIAHQIEMNSICGENVLSTPSASVPNTPAANAGKHPDPYGHSDWSKENFKPDERHPENIPSTPLAVKRKKEFSTGFNFRYNQGSSQAVRRNIRIDSLFFK